MKNLRKNKSGISLIVLVITIIVMIILAATIILSLSNSGIIGKANKAKTDSDKAAIREIINDVVVNSMLGEDDDLLDKVVSRLEENGVEVKQETSNTLNVKSVSIDTNNISLNSGSSVEKAITIEQDETQATKTYAVIQGDLYELYESAGQVKLAETPTDNSSGTTQNLIEVTGASYTTVNVDQTNKKITITAGNNSGTDTLTIKCGNKEFKCTVEVKAVELISFTIKFTGKSKGEVTYQAEKGMTWEEFSKSDYDKTEGYVQSDWCGTGITYAYRGNFAGSLGADTDVIIENHVYEVDNVEPGSS